VFLVDDHRLVRRSLRGLLEDTDDLRVVGEASTGAEVLLDGALDGVSVLILDLGLPDIPGTEVLQRLAQRGAAPPVDG